MKHISKNAPFPFLRIWCGRCCKAGNTDQPHAGLRTFQWVAGLEIPLGEDAWELCHFTEEEPGIWRAVSRIRAGNARLGWIL